MRIIEVEQGSDEWRAFREEKISGSKVGKLFAKSRKSGEMYDTSKRNLMFYEILAERLTVGAQDGIDEESAMERGHTLEPEARERAVEALKLKNARFDGVWQDPNNQHYICSPDGFEDSDKPTWAMEIKCLSSANHIKAIVEGKYPSDYFSQVLNYFLLNDHLKTLYFVMYDPRFLDERLQLKIFTVKREEVQAELERLRDIREEAEQMINDIVSHFTF